MDARLFVIDLIEKMCLLATAGLLSVLLPPLRSRLLGVGRPRDEWAGAFFGLLLALWGGRLGDLWQGYHVNLGHIGILMAAFFAGPRVGLMVGVLAGAFYVFRVERAAGVYPVITSGLVGYVAGLVNDRHPRYFTWADAFTTALTAQVVGISVSSVLAMIFAQRWPGPAFIEATTIAIVMNASGFALQTAVARVVLLREEHAAALAEARASAQALALESLRRRLEPHFLFNALNTLRATIRLDPVLARELVADIADLYRYLLHHPDDASLASEVSHATSYLMIERARLGSDRVRIVTDLPPELASLRVPALLLQPLVENAVKHGIANRRNGGSIAVRALRRDDFLVIEVEDRGEGASLGEPEKGSGIALETLRQIILQRFGSRAGIELVRNDESTTARVRLPFDALGATETLAATETRNVTEPRDVMR
jgi:two-component system LytT family sensor kinase